MAKFSKKDCVFSNYTNDYAELSVRVSSEMYLKDYEEFKKLNNEVGNVVSRSSSNDGKECYFNVYALKDELVEGQHEAFLPSADFNEG